MSMAARVASLPGFLHERHPRRGAARPDTPAGAAGRRSLLSWATGMSGPAVPVRLPPVTAPVVASLARGWAAGAIALVVGVSFALVQPYDNRPPIRADGLGYHVWTRALREHDLSFCGYPELELVGAIARRDERRQVCLNKYPMGLALLRFPVMAPLVDRRPGLPLVSKGEQIGEPGPVCAGAGRRRAPLTGGRALFALGARPVVANLAVVAAVFGTGLFHYATYDGSFTHVYVALGVAALVWLGVRFPPSRPPPWWPVVVAGAVCFFMVSMRSLHLLAVAACCSSCTPSG